MARKKRTAQQKEVQDYRHDTATRKNNPPAGIAAQGKIKETPKQEYAYNPHLPPNLRSDPNGDADKLPELLQIAQQRALTAEETKTIAEALRHYDGPWLEWAGKQEAKSFTVDPVALHIHERVSAKAILKVAERQNVQRELFADPQQDYSKAVDFYQHDVDWANRLILGDSLTVMSSLAHREDLAGKVQMIYIDPPYGIKFASNFQPTVFQRDVKDRAQDLTREREQIKAYRDTWTLGVHSYLAYLRDRLIVARELLTDSGSIFVQISDENVHRVRCIMDEVFGSENFVSVVTFNTTTARTAKYLNQIFDYLIWYSKDLSNLKYQQLFSNKIGHDGHFNKRDEEGRHYYLRDLSSQGVGNAEPFEFRGRIFTPPHRRHWSTNPNRLPKERIEVQGNYVRAKVYKDDFPVSPIHNKWDDTQFGGDKYYVVQTHTKPIERCLLMTTDPGDLVLDPTCVRKGTKILTPSDSHPPVSPRKQGEAGSQLTDDNTPERKNISSTPQNEKHYLPAKNVNLPPLAGGRGGKLTPAEGKLTLTAIENLRPGDYVFSHTGKLRRVRRVIQKTYRGQLIGIQHNQSPTTLWVTADHYILCKQRILSYKTDRAWGKVPTGHFERSRKLRKEMTSAERTLWNQLRNKQLGVKFRRQHPIGPYIADFYTRDIGLIIEVDGTTHFTPEAQSYDTARTDYLRQLGLSVLRFTNLEVFRHLDAVIKQIKQAIQVVHPSETLLQQWRRSDTLQVSDIIYCGVNCKPVEIVDIQCIDTHEDVYDLEVETDHSYLTEVCAVHNCGSGTTAYVAERWGRRWITTDTSRVAIALARQRLLTGSFDYYTLKDKPKGIVGGFINKTVPHITLKSIAQNTALDPIFVKYEPILKGKLDTLNRALAEVTPEIRSKLLSKLAEKERREGKRAITEADRRRWILPDTAWQEWEVPYDTDPDWPQTLQEALTGYREAYRAKMDEVNACIAKSSEGEELVDQPEIDRKRIRVSGPFTVEAVQPPEESLDVDSPIGGEPDEPLDTYHAETDGHNADNAEAYLDQMIRLLRNDGVRFPNNQTLKFATLDSIEGDILHAEGSWEDDDTERLVAVVFGPQHGPVTTLQVEECLPIASRRGYDELVFAGFSFDGAAQAIIQEDPNPRVRIHMAHINPDVAMGDLLKETPSTQLFTVFGMPRTQLEETTDGEYYIKMEGVDIYNPVDNTVNSAGADQVAAWFVDADYDGRTFCITQAFFPDKSAWNKIARALRGVIDEDQFEKFSGTESFPFPVGEHACVAVKVIDPRGNEVMSVHHLRNQIY